MAGPWWSEDGMIEFDVQDMSCGHCVAAITRALAALDAAAVVQTDLATHRVRVQSTRPVQALRQAIEDAGFTPGPVSVGGGPAAGTDCGVAGSGAAAATPPIAARPRPQPAV